jgi:competence/damage-inducible protein CinA-like protein
MPSGPPPLSRIELVTIGDELLLGFTIDSNAAHIARELAAIGVKVVRRATVGDDTAEIASAVQAALDRTGAVITTGGLGPTSDDLTKPAIAQLFGRSMHVDEAHVLWMEDRWQRRFGRSLPLANRRQAMIPDGARVLENRHGSAPGIWLEDDSGRWVAMLPGVPREMRGMMADVLLPTLAERAMVGGATVVRSRTLRTTGVAESLLADNIDSMDGEPLGASLAYLPSIDGVDLRLTVHDLPPDEADAVIAIAASRLVSRVGGAVYGEQDADLAAIVLELCRSRNDTIGIGESCTGGMLGARLTAIPGSSDVFRGGAVTYHDDLKESLLGVSTDSLARHGAVSEAVVRQMAAGARRIAGASIGLAITGVAGPTGGTEEKPVGTVWIGVDFRGDVHARLLNAWGDRQENRYRATQATLELLRHLLQSPAETAVG